MTQVLRHSPIPGKDDLLARKRRDRVDALDLRKRVFRGKLDPIARRQDGRSDGEIDSRVHPVVRSPQRVGVRVEELDRVPVYDTGQTTNQLECSTGCRRDIGVDHPTHSPEPQWGCRRKPGRRLQRGPPCGTRPQS